MKINVALIGLGNVASALVQGIEYYKQSKEKPLGILKEIEKYFCTDINFCLGIDVNKNKINKDLSEAIFIEPNCAIKIILLQI